jgi:hypothetical protein
VVVVVVMVMVVMVVVVVVVVVVGDVVWYLIDQIRAFIHLQ